MKELFEKERDNLIRGSFAMNHTVDSPTKDSQFKNEKIYGKLTDLEIQ